MKRSIKGGFDDGYQTFNEHKLDGQPLTDIEFEREDGSQLYVELMNTKDWCKNLFQVTTQTTVCCSLVFFKFSLITLSITSKKI